MLARHSPDRRTGTLTPRAFAVQVAAYARVGSPPCSKSATASTRMTALNTRCADMPNGGGHVRTKAAWHCAA